MKQSILVITALLASIVTPIKLNDPLIKYPDLARQARIEGNITVVFKVLPDGTTVDHKVVQHTSPVFINTALEYSKELIFENKSGDTLLYRQPFVFKLYSNK